jgi:GT2 family glycosyltransferase
VGIRSATGDVVVSLDDDVLPEPDLVLRHAEYHLAHPGAEDAALGELYVPDELLADPMSIFHLFPYHEVRHGGLLDFFHFWTCNLSLKRDFMLRHGMFDEGFPYYEDMLCGHRLASHGMRLRFHPAARGAHLHQLKPAGVPAKGRYVGRWLHAFVQRLPERCVKERYGILSRDIGYPLLLRRLAMRAGFRALDNPLTHAALRGLGATNGRRSRWSDLHYFLLFRRNMLAGYAEAEREARAGAPPMPARPETLRIDRGES